MSKSISKRIIVFIGLIVLGSICLALPVKPVMAAAPEINLKQGVTNIADGGSYNYGSHLLNTNTDIVFTIENVGTGNLTITLPLTLGGADAGQFSIIDQPDSTNITESSSDTFTVRFTPTSTGLKTATIEIANTDADENPYHLTLNGTGVAPEIDLDWGGSLPSGSTHDFGNSDLSTLTETSFTIKNTGTADLHITLPLVLTGDTTQFSIIVQPATATIAPAGSTTFTIRFQPTSLGVKNASVTIVNDDADESNYVLNFTGTGIAGPVITNLDGDNQNYNPFIGGEAIFDVGLNSTVTDADSANFNTGWIIISIDAGGTPAEDILGISTAGTITLSAGMTVGSTVSVGGTIIGTISNNGSAGNILKVTFNANATPARVTTLVRALFYQNTNNVNPSFTTRYISLYIVDAVGGAASDPAYITINMISPEINIQLGGVNVADGSTINLGNIMILDPPTTLTFTIQNTGTSALTLTLPITLGGANAALFSIAQQPVSPIAPSGATTFIITFSPSSAGIKTATISIVNNDGNENPYDITITARVVTLPPPPVVENVVYTSGTEIHVELGADGQTQHTYSITSTDNNLNINIPQGTTITDENGNPVSTITITTNTNPPAPPPGITPIGPVFNLGPDDTNFDPPMVITFHYDDLDVPPGVSETSLRICFYNEATGAWIECECTIDIVNNTITASITHFSNYTIMPYVNSNAFTLSNLNVGQTVSEGQATALIFVDVTNTGTTSGSFTLILNVNGGTINTRTVTLAAGAVETVSFILNNQSPGVYNVDINGFTGSYEISLPASMETAPATPAASTDAALDQTTPPTASSPVAPAAESTLLSGWLIFIIAMGAGLALVLIIWGATRKAR